MARGYNKVVLIGNLARDPEIKQTSTQKAFARFTVAVNREWKDANGEKRSEADFVNCQAWGKLADIVSSYCAKGKQVLVDGRLSVYKYQDKETGKDRWSTEVIADTVLLLGSKSSDGSNGGNDHAGQRYSSSAYQYSDEPDYPLDISQLGTESYPSDEVPF